MPRLGRRVRSTFDPLSDLFVAQFARPARLGPVNLRALTPFQRALLVIDGTVTKFIEAYTMEPVDTRRLSQELRELAADHPWLEAPAGTPVIARTVLLRGEYSQTIYAYASSLVVPDRLPAHMSGMLTDPAGSLGRMLQESRMETRREVLWYGREPSPDLPPELRTYATGEVIGRTYRILTGGRPVMLINEKFPSLEAGLPTRE